jgi:hypothetical protein
MTTPTPPTPPTPPPPPPTPPIEAQGGEFAPEPPRDALDSLLRDWHSAPAPNSGRSRLLSALEAEDSEHAPEPIPFPAAPKVVVRPSLLRYAGIAAALLLVGSVGFLVLRTTAPVNAPSTAKKLETDTHASEEHILIAGVKSESPKGKEVTFAAGRASVAPAEIDGKVGAENARLRSDANSAGLVSAEPPASDMTRSAYVDAAAKASDSAAASPPTTSARPEAEAQNASVASAPAQGTVELSKNAAARGLPSLDKTRSDRVNESGENQEQLLSRRAQRVLSPTLQEMAIRNFYSQTSQEPHVQVGNAVARQQTTLQNSQVAPNENKDAKASTPPPPLTDSANTGQFAGVAQLPVTLRLNDFTPATSEFILNRSGVTNLRSVSKAGRVFEADASEDWLLILAEFEFIDRVELRPVAPPAAAPAQTQNQPLSGSKSNASPPAAPANQQAPSRPDK